MCVYTKLQSEYVYVHSHRAILQTFLFAETQITSARQSLNEVTYVHH